MQRFAVCALLSLSLIGCAGIDTVPATDQSFAEIHDVSMTKKEIYDRSLEWMARTFVDSKAVIELKDPDAGKIIGKGKSSINKSLLGMNVPVDLWFTMMIDAKDNHYRTTYEGMTVGEARYPAQSHDEIEKVKEQLRTIDQSLLKFLSDKSDKDW